MFADLLEIDIQPKEINVVHIPELKLPDDLKIQVKQALVEEENNYVNVSDTTTVVQTDKNFVFFSNQWFYLTVLCKAYAECLKPYADFFDTNIRGNQNVINALAAHDYSNEEWVSLLDDEIDRERMIKFIESDSEFRPGKSLLNGDRIRTTKDIFGSCILKKIAVPDASSAYLGNLVYYLAKRPILYNRIEEVVKHQMGNVQGMHKLNSKVKDCAKEIVDITYNLDRFERLKALLKDNGSTVKIDWSLTQGLLTTNSLRYMFEKPESIRFEGEKERAFQDREYEIECEEGLVGCKLSTEWKGNELNESDQGNNVNALILVVNKYYSDVIKIVELLGEKYIMYIKDSFKVNDLPDVFQNNFAKRYVTSLLAKPFVILTGNSGTGKTRISKQFAEYLECKTQDGNKNWEIVPVGADWTDNSRILGFYNPIANDGKGKYEPTQIVKLIEEANKNKDIPFFLILDEMNLSHVERYFSDFLSHMETPDTNFVLDGYEGEEEHIGQLRYPDNLFVVGTVNIDETTYMFSPKVLDRANVIEFKPEKEEVMKLFAGDNSAISVNPANDGSAEAFLKLAKEIRSGKFALDNEGKKYFSSEESADSNIEYVEKVFSEIYEIIKESEFEFAFRTVKEIRQYISASFEIATEDIKLEDIVDEQLLQKVLPKIHGNRKEIGTVLKKLEEFSKDNGLELSERKIIQMDNKLTKVQYASFI